MPNGNPTLSEYTIDQLVSEITSRCPVAIILVVVPENDESCETRAYHHGNRFCRIGMLEVQKTKLVNDVNSNSTSENMDDENE
jgi:hypothetical protein